jgi:NAD(P)-dependent dehydrogenase (short-subunit alcohol dehydrogenase family)
MPTVLISGASRGIGRASALAHDKRGLDVIAGVRTEDAASALKAEASGRLRTVTLDVTDADSIARVTDSVQSLDALVNNAGIAVGGVVEALDLDELRHQLEVNVVGQVALTQALIPKLRETKGRVVFISSVSGRVSTPMMTPYTASKHAIEAIADGLRVELRPWGIAVVLVEPGSIDTDIWRGASDQFEQTVAKMSDEHRRLYDPMLKGGGKLIRATAKRAAPVEKVVKAVEAAVTAPKPKTRYVVGADARGQLAMKSLLPDRAFDRVIAKMVGSP